MALPSIFAVRAKNEEFRKLVLLGFIAYTLQHETSGASYDHTNEYPRCPWDHLAGHNSLSAPQHVRRFRLQRPFDVDGHAIQARLEESTHRNRCQRRERRRSRGMDGGGTSADIFPEP